MRLQEMCDVARIKPENPETVGEIYSVVQKASSVASYKGFALLSAQDGVATVLQP